MNSQETIIRKSVRYAAQKQAKQCPVCGASFVGRIDSVFCSKECLDKGRSKRRNIQRSNFHTVSDGKKKCASCGETKSVDLFDKTPKGSFTAACHDCRREWRKLNKQIRRSIDGATPREQIAALAQKKREIRAAKSAEYQAMLEEKRRNRMTPAQEWKHRYWTDQEYHEKEKKRVSEKKKTVPYWYANQLLGGSSTKQYPPELVFTKQLSKRIDNFIKEQRP